MLRAISREYGLSSKQPRSFVGDIPGPGPVRAKHLTKLTHEWTFEVRPSDLVQLRKTRDPHVKNYPRSGACINSGSGDNLTPLGEMVYRCCYVPVSARCYRKWFESVRCKSFVKRTGFQAVHRSSLIIYRLLDLPTQTTQ